MDTEAAWTPRAETGLTYDEAYEAAVCGYRIRCNRIQEGAYVDYNFSGLRINFPGGSSSGFTAREDDVTAEWEIVDKAPKPVDKWGQAQQSVEPKRDSWGRAI